LRNKPGNETIRKLYQNQGKDARRGDGNRAHRIGRTVKIREAPGRDFGKVEADHFILDQSPIAFPF
jgi:hypothetical protein